MRRIILLIIMAFLISGGTVGILYQEGIGGIERSTNAAMDSGVPTNVPDVSTVPETPAVTVEEAAEEPEEEAIEEIAEEEVSEPEDEETEDADEEDAEDEEAAAAEAARAEKEAGAPYYKVIVKDEIGALNLYGSPDGEDLIGTAEVGSEGYLIEETDGRRNLVYIDGKIAYITKLYTELVEIDMDDYPDELLRATADDVGEVSSSSDDDE